MLDSLKCFVMKKNAFLQLQHRFKNHSMFQGTVFNVNQK